jgi:hypothetical protein
MKKSNQTPKTQKQMLVTDVNVIYYSMTYNPLLQGFVIFKTLLSGLWGNICKSGNRPIPLVYSVVITVLGMRLFRIECGKCGLKARKYVLFRLTKALSSQVHK